MFADTPLHLEDIEAFVSLLDEMNVKLADTPVFRKVHGRFAPPLVDRSIPLRRVCELELKLMLHYVIQFPSITCKNPAGFLAEAGSFVVSLSQANKFISYPFHLKLDIIEQECLRTRFRFELIHR